MIPLVTSEEGLEPALGPLDTTPVPVERHYYSPVWSGGGAQAPVIANDLYHVNFVRFLRRLPAEVVQKFDAATLTAISRATIPEKTHHTIEHRVSLPFFGRRFYMAFFAGPERRSMDRLLQEQQVHIRRVAFSSAVLIAVLIVVGFTFMTMGLYAIKSASGIDVFQDTSVFHDIANGLGELNGGGAPRN